MKKNVWQKQIPTILGVGVLVVALIGGVIAFTMQNGPTVFAPRASPQTTPKKIKVTNVVDTSFTISFFTDEKTAGFIKYGTEEKSLKSQASDDRDQLTGSISPYNMHHVTIRGLQPATTYYYVLGTGNKETFDNNGVAFSITTAKKAGSPPAAKTAYGSVLDDNGSPAEGAVVYITTEGAGDLSSLVKNSGSWAIPLSTARMPDGSGYAKLEDTQAMLILVQGNAENKTATLNTTVGQSQPVESISLVTGGSSKTVEQVESTASAQLATMPEPTTEDAAQVTPIIPLSDVIPTAATASGGLTNLLGQTSTPSAVASPSTVVDLNKTTAKPVTVTTDQPVITGVAKPNVQVVIEVHSDTQITQTVAADQSGAYELDLKTLSQNLEPGEHTVTIKYTDPTTGKEVTTTKTFYVEPQATSAVTKTATPSPSPSATLTSTSSATSPYGTGKPYALSTPTPTATASSRVSYPSTSSGVPTSGSVGTTFLLVLGGIFFIMAGMWSFWIANSLREDELIAQ